MISAAAVVMRKAMMMIGHSGCIMIPPVGRPCPFRRNEKGCRKAAAADRLWLWLWRLWRNRAQRRNVPKGAPQLTHTDAGPGEDGPVDAVRALGQQGLLQHPDADHDVGNVVQSPNFGLEADAGAQNPWRGLGEGYVGIAHQKVLDEALGELPQGLLLAHCGTFLFFLFGVFLLQLHQFRRIDQAVSQCILAEDQYGPGLKFGHDPGQVRSALVDVGVLAFAAHHFERFEDVYDVVDAAPFYAQYGGCGVDRDQIVFGGVGVGVGVGFGFGSNAHSSQGLVVLRDEIFTEPAERFIFACLRCGAACAVVIRRIHNIHKFVLPVVVVVVDLLLVWNVLIVYVDVDCSR